MGLLSLLDEESKFPRSTDHSLASEWEGGREEGREGGGGGGKKIGRREEGGGMAFGNGREGG